MDTNNLLVASDISSWKHFEMWPYEEPSWIEMSNFNKSVAANVQELPFLNLCYV